MGEVKIEIDNLQDHCVESSYEETAVHVSKDSESDGKPKDDMLTFKAKRHKINGATKSKPYCDTCGKTFVNQGSLQLHLKLHLEKKSYVCEFCGRAFRRSHHLKNHVLSHQGLKPYTCDICDQSFSEKRGLKNHLAIHSGVKQKECHICGKRFWHSDGLRKHVNKVHEIEGKRYRAKRSEPCEICGKTFYDDRTLMTHMRIHTGEKEASCSICKKDFSRKTSLYRHIRRWHNPLMLPKKRGQISRKRYLTKESKYVKKKKGIQNDMCDDISKSGCKSNKKHGPSEDGYADEQEIDVGTGNRLRQADEQEWASDLFDKIKQERVLSDDEATIPYCESSDEDDQYSSTGMLGTSIKIEGEDELEKDKVTNDVIPVGTEKIRVAVTVGHGSFPFVQVKNEPADTFSETDEEDLKPMMDVFK